VPIAYPRRPPWLDLVLT